MKIKSDGNELVTRLWDNWHAHFRQGPLLEFLVEIFIQSGWRRRIVAEPNTQPPKLTGQEAIDYCLGIKDRAAKILHGQEFMPIPVLQITEKTTSEMVLRAY